MLESVGSEEVRAGDAAEVDRDFIRFFIHFIFSI